MPSWRTLSKALASVVSFLRSQAEGIIAAFDTVLADAGIHTVPCNIRTLTACEVSGN